MSYSYSELFSRNLGFILEAEQEKLRKSTIGIAGVGGVGGLLAERLIRIGVGSLRICDPGLFEPSNLNRQLCSSMGTLNRNKAEVISAHLKDINPEATIDLNIKGIETQDDANQFLDGCDLVVDEMDFGMFQQAVYLQRAARQRGIYYLFSSAIGFGALTVIFSPDGMTLEEYNGFDPAADPAQFEGSDIPMERFCPVVPSYSSHMPVEIINEILNDAMPAPTNSIGVGLAAILTANETVNILIVKRDIPVAPQYTCIDLLDRNFGVGILK
jgi:molybdopterin/thiamine biosynthesis adenylyltransferase